MLLLVGMNAAVGGILGDDPANMMYFGVLLVGLIGAIILNSVVHLTAENAKNTKADICLGSERAASFTSQVNEILRMFSLCDLCALCGSIAEFRIIGRLEPQGMSRALFATAFAMVLVPAIALMIGTPAFANGVAAVFGLHAVFALLFVGSALLFRRAGAHRA